MVFPRLIAVVCVDTYKTDARFSLVFSRLIRILLYNSLPCCCLFFAILREMNMRIKSFFWASH